MRTLLSILSFLLVSTVLAQSGRLTLHGRMVQGDKTVPNVSIEVIKDNQIILESFSQKNGSYKIDLPLGSVYNIAFLKDDYITKQVGVIATHPTEDISGMYFFQLDLELFKVDSADVAETILPPVAKLYIKEKEKGFTYDKDYVKWVAEHYEEIDEEKR